MTPGVPSDPGIPSRPLASTSVSRAAARPASGAARMRRVVLRPVVTAPGVLTRRASTTRCPKSARAMARE